MPSERVERFHKLAQAQPANLLFRFSLGQALLQEGDPASAEPHLREAAASKSDWMMARILLGQALSAQGRISEARPVMEEALSLARAQGHEDPELELIAWLQTNPA